MRIVAALGGNALARRGEAPTVERQVQNVRSAATALAEPENPQCDDGIDNDNDGNTDFDDPQCSALAVDREHRPACGIGAELVGLLVPGLWLARRRLRQG